MSALRLKLLVWSLSVIAALSCGGKALIAVDETGSSGDSEASTSMGEVPTPLPNTVDVEVAGHSTCALGDGRLRCWGIDFNHRLGYSLPEPCECVGTPTDECCVGDDEVPAAAGDVEVGGFVSQVAMEFDVTCVLLEQGAVKCWGDNFAGRLGYGHEDPVVELPAELPTIDIGGLAVAVAIGGSRTCVILDDAMVRCWGHGANGVMGHPGVDQVRVPTEVPPIDVGGPVRQLALGSHHTCALLEGGRVRCWGHGGMGLLGYGQGEVDIGDDEPPSAAGDVPIGAPVVAISAGGVRTCALTQAGAVYCWGRDMYRYGYGDPPQNACNMCDGDPKCCIGDDETPAEVGDLAIDGRVEQLSVGETHMCVVLEGGALRCWGSASDSALGYAPSPECDNDYCGGFDPDCCIGDDETLAALPDVDVGARVIDVAAGQFHTCVVTEDMEVRCWGRGEGGGLGRGDIGGFCYQEEGITACVWGDDPGETPAAAGPIQVW